MGAKRAYTALLAMVASVVFAAGARSIETQERSLSEPLSPTPITDLLADAEAGNIQSQRKVGLAYEDEHKYSQAAHWLKRAAEDGDAIAQYHLANLYALGRGVPEDDALALAWYHWSAEQGYVEAQLWLGYMYFQPLVVSQDYGQAAFWWRKAAEQGNAKAQCSLGSLYANGQGVPKNNTEAIFWWRKAADQGYNEALWLLGSLRNETGPPNDIGRVADRDKEEQQRHRNQFLIIAICVALLTAGIFTLIRQRRKSARSIKRITPQSTHARQLIVILFAGTWCSFCCLLQVLDPAAMRHPIKSAVTALLLAIPGIIFGVIGMWWLSHPLPESDPVPFSPCPEPADGPSEGPPEHTERGATQRKAGYKMNGPAESFGDYYVTLNDDELFHLAGDITSLLPNARLALRKEMEFRGLSTQEIDWTAMLVDPPPQASGGTLRRFFHHLFVFAVCDIAYFVLVMFVATLREGVDVDKLTKSLIDLFAHLSFGLAVITSQASLLPKSLLPLNDRRIWNVGVIAPPGAFLLILLVSFFNLGTFVRAIWWTCVILWVAYRWWGERQAPTSDSRTQS
jgi:hypothetical protein